jgi:beta-lactamase superfamily II metal-dependent hydrolase
MNRPTTRSAAALVLLLVLPFGCARADKPGKTAPAPARPLDVYWVDVEGGAATLIVTPAGESVLIDSGFPGERDARRIFNVATEVAGLKQIDHLVTTHYHLDHFGGAPTLATLMPIRHVHDNGLFKEGWEKPSQEYLDFPKETRTVLSPGDFIPLKQSEASLARGTEPDTVSPIRTEGPERATGAGLRPYRTDTVRLRPPGNGSVLSLQCLAARQKFIDPPPDAAPNEDCVSARRQRPDYTDNANSIVLLLTFGDFRFYDGGDLTWNNELKLVCPVKLVPPVDVFQVSHHGQDTSNPPALIRALSPTVAVMNNGPRKGGKPKTMQTLREAPSIRAIYQLHRNVQPGEESANTSDELTANIPEACQGNYVKMSVAPDGRTYTISIPATGYVRTFRTRSN